jgi:hypothetical protein
MAQLQERCLLLQEQVVYLSRKLEQQVGGICAVVLKIWWLM